MKFQLQLSLPALGLPRKLCVYVCVWRVGGVVSGAYYSNGLGAGHGKSCGGDRLLRHPLELRPACNSHAWLMNSLPLTALAKFVPRDFVLLVSGTC